MQIGSPSRTEIKRYHDLIHEVDREAGAHQCPNFRPVRLETDCSLLKRQHSHREIKPYYRAADLCMVTSLHDGMNLVAKEFISARDDEQGVLILSRFAERIA